MGSGTKACADLVVTVDTGANVTVNCMAKFGCSGLRMQCEAVLTARLTATFSTYVTYSENPVQHQMYGVMR